MNENRTPKEIIQGLCDKYGVKYSKRFEIYFVDGNLTKDDSKLDCVSGIDRYELISLISLLQHSLDGSEERVDVIYKTKTNKVSLSKKLTERVCCYLHSLLEYEQDGLYQYEGLLDEFVDNYTGSPYYMALYNLEEVDRILKYERKAKDLALTKIQRLGLRALKLIESIRKAEKEEPESAGVSTTNLYSFIGELFIVSGVCDNIGESEWDKLKPNEKYRKVDGWIKTFKVKYNIKD